MVPRSRSLQSGVVRTHYFAALMMPGRATGGQMETFLGRMAGARPKPLGSNAARLP
jgi:hypothetical protein